MNLHEQLDTLATVMGREAVPGYITDGLPASLSLRPYQQSAISDFIRFFETDALRVQRPTQVLFHMATGSGKTVVMSALMLYLYAKGYRKFIFFVNSTNVLEKTRTNFLDPLSSKYLFAEDLKMKGEPLAVREVGNFQFAEADAINIRFMTIQALHTELVFPREGGLSEGDFDSDPVVFISDEAHHLNALTRQGRSADDERSERTWEGSVNRVFSLHRDNLLLEFTATCDLSNAEIAAKYSNKIVADYPLARFREDRYSKEIKLLQSDLSAMDRALQALVVSQFRFKLFQKHRLTNRPVVLFKSKTIASNSSFAQEFNEVVSLLDGDRLDAVASVTTAELARRAFTFFQSEGITLDALAAELRQDFGDARCLVLDSKNITPEKQLTVNSLENADNPIRAVFAVDMLNEGWDVLNLFDIVRLYETRDARAGRPGKTTIQEAQLIGRGARYCPFVLPENDDTFRRKFDDNIEHELRPCEELYFHSATNERYINELTTALKETGALPDRSVEVRYELKSEFKASDLFTNGWVFLNEREQLYRGSITGLPPNLRSLHFAVDALSGATHTTSAFGTTNEVHDVEMTGTEVLLRDLPPAILGKALRKNDRLRFDKLRVKLPNLKSMSEFIEDEAYLGAVRLTLRTPNASPSPMQWLFGAEELLSRIAEGLDSIELDHRGTKEFRARPLRESFGDRTCYIENPVGDGVGVAQRDVSAGLRLRLSELDWYAYTENYGTTEEKRFLVYFNDIVDRLRARYEQVVVLRNERQIGIFDFETGRRFEPDFVLFLQEARGDGFEQYQVFAEPKGAHLVDKDRWKEDLLTRLERDARTVKRFSDDNEYLVWGLPFFTHEPPENLSRFTDAIQRLQRPRSEDIAAETPDLPYGSTT